MNCKNLALSQTVPPVLPKPASNHWVPGQPPGPVLTLSPDFCTNEPGHGLGAGRTVLPKSTSDLQRDPGIPGTVLCA